MRYIDITDLLRKRYRWGHRKELWKNENLKSDFRKYFFNKCWYSEIKLLGQDAPIDHFRPKAEVRQYGEYNYNYPLENIGYYWLKNSPENYRVCCTYANRKTGDGGKSCFFPLAAGSEYLSENGHENEIPMLIDPCKEDDVKLISFMGNRVISTSHNEFDKARVEISTNIYNLDNPYIKVDRRKVWDEVEKLIEEYQSGEISKKSCLRRLSDMVDKKTMFSACAIACINSMAPDEIKNDLDLKI